MKKASLLCIIGLFFIAETARSAGEERVQVLFKNKSNFDGDHRYLPIALTINDTPSDSAWLDITKNFRIVFNKETSTIRDMSAALQTLRPARNLRYSCEISPLPMCERYKFFVLSYDYDSGRLNVLYELANKKFAALESEPALVVKQSFVYSESQGKEDTYRHGHWSADANAGVTERSNIHSDIYFDAVLGRLSLPVVSYNYDLSDALMLSGYVQKAPAFDLSKVGVGASRGISLKHTKDETHEFDAGSEPLLIDAKHDGLVNIYDEVGKLIGTTHIMQGINRLDIPRSASGNTVRIEEVVDGQVVSTYDRAIVQFGQSSRMFRFDLGMAELRKEYLNSNQTENAPFVRYSQIVNGFALVASALPSVGRYTTSVRLPTVKGLSASIDSTFKEKITDHSVTGGYSASIENYQFYTSLSKQFGASDNMSYSLGASRRLFDNSRIDVYYNQSRNVYEPQRQYNYYYDSMSRKKIVTDYKRVTTRLRTRHNTSVGMFDYTFYASSDMGDDKRVGASVTYTPASKSAWFRPTFGAQSDSGKTNSYLVNEMQVSDRFSMRPEVRFQGSRLDQYGSSASYSNDHFSSDFGYFNKTTSDRNFYINGDSYSHLSSHGIRSHSSPKNSAIVFSNAAANHHGGVPAKIDINGQPE